MTNESKRRYPQIGDPVESSYDLAWGPEGVVRQKDREIDRLEAEVERLREDVRNLKDWLFDAGVRIDEDDLDAARQTGE